jgi:hypothetical protein
MVRRCCSGTLLPCWHEHGFIKRACERGHSSALCSKGISLYVALLHNVVILLSSSVSLPILPCVGEQCCSHTFFKRQHFLSSNVKQLAQADGVGPCVTELSHGSHNLAAALPPDA